jgi:hypothetical protein
MSATSESFLRTLLAVALTATLVGIALAASDHEALGGFVTIVGLTLMIYGLHRFGRTGPDQPLDLANEDPDATEERR